MDGSEVERVCFEQCTDKETPRRTIKRQVWPESFMNWLARLTGDNLSTDNQLAQGLGDDLPTLRRKALWILKIHQLMLADGISGSTSVQGMVHFVMQPPEKSQSERLK